MDWTKIKRTRASSGKPYGPYVNLDDLIRLQFQVADFSLQPQQPVTSILAGRYASRLRGRGLNFEELRQYQSGDDIRTMDWKVTARTKIPHVRVYTEEKDRQVLLLVDQRINMFFGTRDKFKSVTAAEIAAIASWRAIDSGDRIGALVFNDNEIVSVRPHRSNQAVMSILGQIIHFNQQLHVGADTESNNGMLNTALENALRMALKDVLVVLISDCQGADQQTEKHITRLAAHNDVICFLVHDPTRLALAPRRLALSDGKRQIEVDLGDKKIRERLLVDYEQETANLTRFFRKLSAPFLLVNNKGNTSKQIRRLLGVPLAGRNGGLAK